jgi:hypothetical protein
VLGYPTNSPAPYLLFVYVFLPRFCDMIAPTHIGSRPLFFFKVMHCTFHIKRHAFFSLIHKQNVMKYSKGNNFLLMTYI